MKALIISNDEYVISQSSQALKDVGCDLIVYKWLLKALDNIEEIHPDLVLVSANEYPRHWKTLVQFLKSGIGGEKVACYLYEGEPLSEEDCEKAKALGITGTLKGFSDDKIDDFKYSIKEFFNLNEKSENLDINPSPVKSTSVEEECDEIITVEDLISTPENEIENESETGYVLFNNPETQIINTGKVLSYNHNKLECVFDYEFTDLVNNDQITYVSYFNGEECMSFSAEIFILNKDEKTAILTVQEKYEEI